MAASGARLRWRRVPERAHPTPAGEPSTADLQIAQADSDPTPAETMDSAPADSVPADAESDDAGPAAENDEVGE